MCVCIYMCTYMSKQRVCVSVCVDTWMSITMCVDIVCPYNQYTCVRVCESVPFLFSDMKWWVWRHEHTMWRTPSCLHTHRHMHIHWYRDKSINFDTHPQADWPTHEQHSVYSLARQTWQAWQQEQFFLSIMSHSQHLISIHLLTKGAHKASLQASTAYRQANPPTSKATSLR